MERRAAMFLVGALAALAATRGGLLQPHTHPSAFIAAGPQRAAAEGPEGLPSARASGEEGRRQALLGVSLAGTVFGTAGPGAGGPATAFENEENRQAVYQGKATELNEAADFLLFEVRPKLYVQQDVYTPEECESMGDSCPERAGLPLIWEMYRTPPQPRASISLSKVERDLVSPFRILSLTSMFDPDTSEELNDYVVKLEVATKRLGKAAQDGQLDTTRKYYTDTINIVNKYFKLANDQLGVPENSKLYLKPLPVKQTELDEFYWKRRQQKFEVKRKVDAVSKGSKTARFYAKSIFGDDAVSWDQRGDRVEELYGPSS